MRIHHLNCVSSCPLGGYLMDRRSHGLRGRLTCHCLAIESGEGLVLVDTGFGLRDVAAPRTRLSRFFLALTSPEFREEMTAVRQLARLGFDARDVRHIVLSHLDFDHAGGLDDFPEATVHMMADEREAALARPTWMDRQRYRPQQWSSRSRWRVYRAGEGEPWLGFDAVRAIEGLPPELLLVPLIGHTLGHAGVVVARERDWLFYAADAYFFHDEMDAHDPRCPPGLRLYQWMLEKNRAARLWNQQRLRALAADRSAQVTLFCAHDVTEFERVSGRAFDVPIASDGASPASPTPPRKVVPLYGIPSKARSHD